MPQLAFKRPVPLIVAGLAGLLIGLLAYPLLLNQVRTRVIDEQFAHLSDATAAATRMTATVHQALSALASELDLPASPPGCSKELQDRLQAFQLRTPQCRSGLPHRRQPPHLCQPALAGRQHAAAGPSQPTQ